ncbi:hypothetical protein CHS0354_000976 [Potamilus streckersoni]|uniref:Ig-like domain-containing protein n=1 Tax=Potamilus streckersoni TaxID=2493646 RepID=A0AAE0SJ12_9BIVA|nr:hypothetical protein CHS0354_000976 [Potamilus streckersoni]
MRKCYNCHSAASPDDCNRIVKCGYNEVCFEQMMVDGPAMLYTSGCMSKLACTGMNAYDTNPSTIAIGKKEAKTTCSKCCDSDFCNLGLCRSGTAASLRCISCMESFNIFDCDHFEQCSLDEICYSHKRHGSSDLMPRYQTGCLPKRQCEAIAHLTVINQCYECCDTHMCNIDKCGLNWTAIYPTTHQSASTVTTTTPTSTTQLYAPVINGRTPLNYHGIGHFHCTSAAHDVTYTWHFNGSSILAPHATSRQNVLLIRNMTESEVGTYTCVLSKSGSTADASIQVTIKEAPAHVVSVSSWPMPAVSGKELNLHCEVTGYPVPEVHWSFRNPSGMCLIPPNVVFPGNDNVHLSSYKPEVNQGNWTCIAINKLATISIDKVVN